MTVKEFAASLAGSLIDRGVSRDSAVSNVLTIIKTLSEDDLKEITEYTSEADFSKLSDSLASYIKKKDLDDVFSILNETEEIEANRPEYISEEEEAAIPEMSGENALSEEPSGGYDMRNTRVPVPASDDKPQEIILGDDSTIMEKTKLTAKAKLIFWSAALITLPLTAAVGALLLSIFVLSVVAVCAFIVLTFVVVFAEVAGGGAGFFVGTIYGIIKIIGGDVGIGLFEIGIGVVCLGVTLVLAYLTYCFAVKTLPFILKEVMAFWGTVLHRIGLLIGRFREECNRL